MIWQPQLPERYTSMSNQELDAAITARKGQLGDRLIILGHHYQQDDVYKHADFTGDSFKLAQLAAEKVAQSGSQYVVFLGVHFMAESADILTPPDVKVILPDLTAGCSMADMAQIDDVVEAWDAIHAALEERGWSGRIVPVTYMNSTAAIKAFVGEHGGAVCTSSNAAQVIRWALEGGAEPRLPGESIKVMFFPDQHLGRNTAAAIGFDVHHDMTMWDPRTPLEVGGTTPEALERSTILLWKGHCSVHKLFRPEHVDQIKAAEPHRTVIVHPECERAVVEKADMTGSTEKIMRTIREALPGSKWAIGTEVHMVMRLAREAAQRNVHVRILSDCQCLCTTMYRIDPQHLLWVLDNLAEDRVVNQVRVDDETRQWALVSLQRMLDITEVVAA